MTFLRKPGIFDYIFDIKKLLSNFRSDNERVLPRDKNSNIMGDNFKK